MFNEIGLDSDLIESPTIFRCAIVVINEIGIYHDCEINGVKKYVDNFLNLEKFKEDIYE